MEYFIFARASKDPINLLRKKKKKKIWNDKKNLLLKFDAARG